MMRAVYIFDAGTIDAGMDAVFEHIKDAYTLAMEGEGVHPENARRITQTVEDAWGVDGNQDTVFEAFVNAQKETTDG